MTNMKSTKRALIASVLALFLCFAMLLGSTFAWFTDSATSADNVIKSGKLDVEMYWTEGNADPETVTDWKKAKDEAIFNNEKWEPGYTEAKHIKIANEGTLKLKYQMRILADGIVSELADVIDVYYYPTATQLTSISYNTGVKLGSLSEILNPANVNAISNVVAGDLDAGASKIITLALHMRESAGYEYQDLSIGSAFRIQILATQYVGEFDSFNDQYDTDADFAPQELPSAMVSKLTGAELNVPISDTEDLLLDAGYQFEPTETYEQALESEYSWAHADFYIYADKDVAANSLYLAGYYKFFCDNWNDGNWIALPAVDVAAGTGIRLIADGLNGGATNTGITVPYNLICYYGNDGTGFQCGVADVNGANAGTTITVELRLYKTYPEGECPADHNGHSSQNCETGEYDIIGKFTYTMGGEYTTLADGSEVFMGDNGEVWLTDVSNVTADEYYIPDGVTKIESSVFEGNTVVKNVVFPDSVEEIGSRVFKKSEVESVTLNEGLTSIHDYAFDQAGSLTSFNIPSTVTSIGSRAFRGTLETELVIPAGVETVEETFREMTELTKVTFEGNTQISPYCFRGCGKLTEVYLNGEDTTFSARSAEGNVGMYFTNKQSGEADEITIYVKNTTVASRLYAAQAVSSGYTVKIGTDEVALASTAAQFKAAVQNNKYVVLGADISLDETIALNGKDLVIDGNGKTISQADSCANNIALIDSTGGTLTVKNVTFDGIKGGAVIRTVGTDIVIDGVTVQNCEHTVAQGLLRLIGETVIKNSTFKKNDCTMVISQAYDVESSDTSYIAEMTVENCVFEENTCSSTGVLYYAKGNKATINANKFISNTVNTTANGATVYVGFTDNNVITNNLFKNNAFITTGTSQRVAGALMVGGEGVKISGNAFIGNTVSGPNAKGNDVCASTYYVDIDLSSNYWGGSAPVEDDDYFNEYRNNDVIVNDYLTTYEE